MRKLVATLGLPVAIAAVLATGAPAYASGGNDGKSVSGSCSAGADWTLEVKKDDGGLEIEYEVDSNVAGQTWAVSITDNGKKVFKGNKVTKGASGSFSVERHPANLPGTDTVVATATNAASGETCSGTLAFAK